VREEVLLRAARLALESVSASDRSRFEEIIGALCSDPGLDPPLKIEFDVPPVVIYLYNDTISWVAYDLPDEATVRIWMIGRAPDQPRPR